MADAEKLALAVAGFGDAVGMKHENVAWLERDSPLVVGHVFINSQWKARQFDFPTTVVFVQERLRLPGIGDAQLLTALLPRCETRGHEPPLDAPFTYELIHLLQHFRRLQFLRREAAHNSNRHGAIQSRGSSFPAYIAKGEPQLLRAVTQELVQIAAHFASRKIARGDVDTVVVRRHRSEQRALNSFCRLEVALEARFFFSQL